MGGKKVVSTYPQIYENLYILAGESCYKFYLSMLGNIVLQQSDTMVQYITYDGFVHHPMYQINIGWGTSLWDMIYFIQELNRRNGWNGY